MVFLIRTVAANRSPMRISPPINDALVDSKIKVEYVRQDALEKGVLKQLTNNRIESHIHLWMQARRQTNTTDGVLVLFAHAKDFANESA